MPCSAAGFLGWIKRTGKKGFAAFNNVPCGDTAVITVFDSETSNQNLDTPAYSKIACSKSVYLGAFDIYYGSKLSEARANYCYNLNPNWANSYGSFGYSTM